MVDVLERLVGNRREFVKILRFLFPLEDITRGVFCISYVIGAEFVREKDKIPPVPLY